MPMTLKRSPRRWTGCRECAPAQQHFDRHRRRVTRITESGKDIRGEAKDALSHYSEIVAGRQAQVINALTIVATVFLPLSFLTGYFGELPHPH